MLWLISSAVLVALHGSGNTSAGEIPRVHLKLFLGISIVFGWSSYMMPHVFAITMCIIGRPLLAFGILLAELAALPSIIAQVWDVQYDVKMMVFIRAVSGLVE